MKELLHERLLVREAGSGTRNILEELLLARGMKIEDFQHYVEVENMHTIIGFLKKDCGISFMYKVAVEDELKKGDAKEKFNSQILKCSTILILSGRKEALRRKISCSV